MFEYLAVRGELERGAMCNECFKRGIHIAAQRRDLCALATERGMETRARGQNRIAIYGCDVKKIGADKWYQEWDALDPSTNPSGNVCSVLAALVSRKALTAVISRSEDRRRLPNTFIAHPIDDMPPDHRYDPCLPGLQLDRTTLTTHFA